MGCVHKTKNCTVGGGQATLTIPGTNIQIPLGPTQPAQQQTSQVNIQGQQNVAQQQSTQQTSTGQQQQQNQTQNQTNATQNVQQNNQQQQQQNTVIQIPGTNNTIQIPANFGGK
jgi:hypothetical protein